jgi:tetratricopeptide (TPR) repeat protein
MGIGRAVTVFTKIVVLVILMTLLTLLCFVPLRLFAQFGLSSAQYLLLLLLGILVTAFAWWLFRVPPPKVEREPRPPVHPADFINLKFKQEIYWTLRTPSHLTNHEFADLVELFGPWSGGDLLKFIKCFLIPDPTPIARIQHAAAEFSLGSIDKAKRVLEWALAEREAPPAVAIAKADLLNSIGDFTGAADSYHGVLFRFSLGPETRVVLKSRELRSRARAGDFEQTRMECAKFVQQNPTESSIYMLDSLASLPLMYDFPEFVDEALSYNQQALDLHPRLLSLKITKGALLYEKLQREDARRLLHEGLCQTSEDYERALCHFYLALIERKRGHLREAKHSRNTLKFSPKKNGSCFVCTRNSLFKAKWGFKIGQRSNACRRMVQSLLLLRFHYALWRLGRSYCVGRRSYAHLCT